MFFLFDSLDLLKRFLQSLQSCLKLCWTRRLNLLQLLLWLLWSCSTIQWNLQIRLFATISHILRFFLFLSDISIWFSSVFFSFAKIPLDLLCIFQRILVFLNPNKKRKRKQKNIKCLIITFIKLSAVKKKQR